MIGWGLGIQSLQRSCQPETGVGGINTPGSLPSGGEPCNMFCASSWAPVTAHLYSARLPFHPFLPSLLSSLCLSDHLLAPYPYLLPRKFNPRQVPPILSQVLPVMSLQPSWEVPPETRCEPVIVQRMLAAEIKEAPAFGENIGSNSMSFQKTYKYSIS